MATSSTLPFLLHQPPALRFQLPSRRAFRQLRHTLASHPRRRASTSCSVSHLSFNRCVSLLPNQYLLSTGTIGLPIRPSVAGFHFHLCQFLSFGDPGAVQSLLLTDWACKRASSSSLSWIRRCMLIICSSSIAQTTGHFLSLAALFFHCLVGHHQLTLHFCSHALSPAAASAALRIGGNQLKLDSAADADRSCRSPPCRRLLSADAQRPRAAAPCGILCPRFTLVLRPADGHHVSRTGTRRI